ncbi:hypothetical protein PC9H_006545 [Pleurotus ostreatus]|uniref:Ricin B lectin domain-containing protein n=1 Tax=Pleurotus ostreatus TaxID=5322 RepID=A0A8H7DSZ6_PLEOS|nr:uncharacterized protein PC9H_006545 [Pleurotus ostreatus]KAF7430831.1 hypothetical protein PC9H_006545 [Pleurotus ostreatus]
MVNSGSTYIFVNEKAGTVADLSGGDNKSIIGYENHNGDNQKWHAEQQGENFTFKNVATGQYLGIEGEPGENTPVVVVDHPFEWHVTQDDESWRLWVPGTKYNMDLSDHGNPTPGTPVTLWGKWAAGRNQCWRLQDGECIPPQMTDDGLTV